MVTKKIGLIIALAMSMMFMVGCSDNEDGGSIPKGTITESKYAEMKNNSVEEANLDGFFNLFYDALSNENIYEQGTISCGPNGPYAPNNPNGQTEVCDTFPEKDTVAGIESGTWMIKNRNSSPIIEFNDYSDGGNLFFGGGISLRSNETNDVFEVKVNGTIEFRGEFSGSVVFSNFAMKYDYNAQKETTSGKIIVKSNGKEIEVDINDYEMLYAFLDPLV